MFFIFSILSLLICELSAHAKHLVINQDHSSISFTVPYMIFSEVEGRFSRFTGSMDLSDENQVLNAEIIIDSSSIDTNHKMRDAHLRENVFFDAKKYPYIKINYDLGVYRISYKDKIILRETTPISLNIRKDSWDHLSYFQKELFELHLADFDFKWNKSLPSGDKLIGEKVLVKGIIQWQEIGNKTLGSEHKIPDTKSLNSIHEGMFKDGEYKLPEPEMVEVKNHDKRKVRENPSSQISKKDDFDNWLSFSVLFLIGLFSLVGLYILIKIQNIEKKWINSYFVDAFFISVMVIYFEMGWMICGTAL